MTRSITCKNCSTQFTADLSHAPGDELTVACPKCGQKYKLRTAARTQPPAAPTGTPHAASSAQETANVPLGLLISAGVAAIGTFLPWLTTGASASVSGIGSYSTSFGSSSGISLWHGEIAFVSAIASIFLFWKGQSRKAGFVALLIPVVCILGGLHAASVFDVGSSFGGASFHGSSSPGIGILITGLAGIVTSILAFRGPVKQPAVALESVTTNISPPVVEDHAPIEVKAPVVSTAHPDGKAVPTAPRSVSAPKRDARKMRLPIISGASVLVLLASTWLGIELSKRHTLTEAERAQAEGWLDYLRGKQWVLVSQVQTSRLPASLFDDLRGKQLVLTAQHNPALKEYTLTCQPAKISADSYGKTSITLSVDLISSSTAKAENYSSVMERAFTDLAEPAEISLANGSDAAGKGSSIKIRRIASDSILVEFSDDRGVGHMYVGIPESRFSTLQEESAVARKNAFIHTVDSLTQNGGLVRRGLFRSYACGDECVATFLIMQNGQPANAAYVCNYNRFGDIQLSQGNMIGKGDFTNQAIVGKSFLIVTQRTMVETEEGGKAPVDVITGLLSITDEDITPELQQRLAVAANVDMLSATGADAPNATGTAQQFLGDGAVRELKDVQEQPQFPGGSEAMYAFLNRAVKYPDAEFDAGVQGKVYVEFVVASDGSIRDVKVKRGVAAGLDQEALRVVRSMPRWSPARSDGKPVNCRFIIPLTFALH